VGVADTDPVADPESDVERSGGGAVELAEEDTVPLIDSVVVELIVVDTEKLALAVPQIEPLGDVVCDTVVEIVDEIVVETVPETVEETVVEILVEVDVVTEVV
jgi:hypothetical protein